jgi:hypothetical protein
MSTPRRHQALEAAAEAALLVIHQHRLVTTSQVRELVLPGRTSRRTQEVLAGLARRALVASVAATRPGRGPAENVWFLTRRGADAVEAPDNAEPRRRLLKPEQAAGPLQAHTLAVNDVGVALTRGAWGRRPKHEFDSRSWRHEIAHDYQVGKHRRLVVADAVLTYNWHDDDGLGSVTWFLELDRGNSLAQTLAGKLIRYTDLDGVWHEYHATDDHHRLPVWPSWYWRFPRVRVVFASSTRADAARRMSAVMQLCERRDEFRNATWEFSFGLLADLLARGPFAPIFRQLHDGQTYNFFDWSPDDEKSTSTEEETNAA